MKHLRPGVSHILLVAALLALPACSQDAPPSPTAPSHYASPVEEQLQVDTAATEKLVQDRVSLPWKLEATHGRALSIRVESGGCAAFDRMRVREEGAQVLLAAVADRRAPDASATPYVRVCHLQRVLNDVTVKLRSPLGQRHLVHAAVTPDWESRQ